MGQFLKDATVKVGLVGVSESIAHKLIDRLTTNATNDPGIFEAIRYTSLAECRCAVNSLRVNAICIAPESFDADSLTSFISNIRVTHPLIPFCLVGTSSFLRAFPNYHQAWKDKFSHYYKLSSDVEDNDFAENAGLLRDLFVADSVKCRALGQYETTPGAVVRLQAPRPYGFWLLVVVPLLAAVIGGAVAPVLGQVWPSSEPIALNGNGVPQQQRSLHDATDAAE